MKLFLKMLCAGLIVINTSVVAAIPINNYAHGKNTKNNKIEITEYIVQGQKILEYINQDNQTILLLVRSNEFATIILPAEKLELLKEKTPPEISVPGISGYTIESTLGVVSVGKISDVDWTDFFLLIIEKWELK
jgi:hypothetical protein